MFTALKNKQTSILFMLLLYRYRNVVTGKIRKSKQEYYRTKLNNTKLERNQIW